jgi:hypothetical protein
MHPVPDGEPTFGRTVAVDPGADRRFTTLWSARNVVVGVLVACGALVAAVLIVGGDDPTAVDDSTATTEAPGDTIERTSTTIAPRPTSTTPSPAAAPVTPSAPIALPSELAAIATPTEVLMLGSDGTLHTLSLPSGTMRSVPVAPGTSDVYPGQGLIVAPDAASLQIGNDVVIVSRDGVVIEVDPNSFDAEGVQGVEVVGWREASDGTTRFLVVGYGAQPRTRTYEVGLDGVVTTMDGDASDPFREFSTIRTGDGRAFLNDAGGVYELGVDGEARRIDDGMLRAASPTSLLIRKCTPELDCGDVLVDRTTGERRPIAEGIVPDDMQFPGYGLDLAPDGSAVSGVVDVPNGQELAVVDLVTGDRISTEMSSWARGTRWAADSSGVFETSTSSPGVHFLSRATGEVVTLAADIGVVVALAVRHPASELGATSTVTNVPITLGDGEESATTGLDVVVLTRNGSIVDVDLDAKSAGVWTAPPPATVRNPTLLRVGDRVAVVSDDADGELAGYIAVPDEQVALPPGLFGPGPILSGPSPGTAWTSATTSSDAAAIGVQQVLVDLEAGVPAEPGRAISVPGGVLLGGDGRGNLVVERGGDIYIATSEGNDTALRRLTTGELLAIGADTAYVRECDELSTCSVVRVDRADDSRTVLPESLGLLSATAIDSQNPPVGLVGTGVAPGGDLAVVPTGGGWMLVDMVDGPFATLENLDGDAPFVWSADGTSAVTVIGADLVVVGRDGTAVVEGLGSVRALAGPIVASVEAD